MPEQTQNTKSLKDGLALIIGGLFVLGLVFATYRYFNQTTGVNDKDVEDSSAIVKLKDTISSKTQREEDKEEIQKPEVSGDKSTLGVTTTEPTVAWVANDYNQGDISGGTYTVKSGDTLWEIAEAVYGNGGDWVKIRDANTSLVGFMPSGQQSLIMPGQTLVLP